MSAVRQHARKHLAMNRYVCILTYTHTRLAHKLAYRTQQQEAECDVCNICGCGLRARLAARAMNAACSGGPTSAVRFAITDPGLLARGGG